MMFQNRKLNLILSIIGALVLWIYVTGTVDPVVTKKFERVPVTLINKENLTNSNLSIQDTDPLFVDITVKGNRTTIRHISKTDIKANADLYDGHKGKNYFPIEVILPKELKLEAKSADNIMVQIDKIGTVSKKVMVTVSGNLPSDTTLGYISVLPEDVSITGASQNLQRIKSITAKVPASQLSFKEKTFITKAVALDRNGKEIRNISISPQKIKTKVRLHRHKDVKLEIKLSGNIAKGYVIKEQISPKNITIEGEDEVLKNITEIVTYDINIEGLDKSKTYILNLKLPKGIKLVTDKKDLILKLVLEEE